MRTLIATVLGVAALSPAGRQEDGLVVDRVKFADVAFDDLAHLLKIRKASGEYSLSGPISRVTLVVEVYRKGALQEKSVRSNSMQGKKGADRSGQFTFQVADLEHLRLGDAKGAWRLHFCLKEGAASTSAHSDLPKEWFDFGAILASGTFLPKVTNGKRIPLLWHVSGNAKSVAFGETPSDVVERNRDLDVLIASLEAE